MCPQECAAMIEWIIGNLEGMIVRLDLLPSFSHLRPVKKRGENKNQRGGWSRFGAYLVDEPDKTYSEHFSPSNTANFFQELAFPQHAQLERLANSS